ncbi:MAG: 50S ribosomal protein L33 [Erysipelotrichia bacterium]|jgi:large subunit ribosomal protein L33|nr:50S ribosomal protein L33 [Bacilli bacterium]NLB49478.1 50S ribosomal protein L33 [Erysipelotrichia bacterium]
MASKNKTRRSVTLKCTVCGEENYITSVNKKNNPDRLEKNKLCTRCNKMTIHKEKK